MIKIYEAENTFDAQLISDYLQARGIKVMVSGMYLQGAMGELPVDARPAIHIYDERDKTLALKIIREILPEASDQGEWRCPKCGEVQPNSFDVCWACGEGRPDEE